MIDQGELRIPHRFNRYFEPFLGGGAAFFGIRPQKALLSDANTKLIETYIAIRDHPGEVWSSLLERAKCHSSEYYYKIRNIEYDSAPERASQFLYLNRACFNGIYRENLRGEFNVPKGSKKTIIFDTDNFVSWSEALRYAQIEVADFETTINQAEAGDFVFADPPYTVKHNNNGFVKYNQKIFSWEDQKRLANALKRASERGVWFVATNADHSSVRELYDGIGGLRSVGRHSVIAASSGNRSSITELVISALPHESVTISRSSTVAKANPAPNSQQLRIGFS